MDFKAAFGSFYNHVGILCSAVAVANWFVEVF